MGTIGADVSDSLAWTPAVVAGMAVVLAVVLAVDMAVGMAVGMAENLHAHGGYHGGGAMSLMSPPSGRAEGAGRAAGLEVPEEPHWRCLLLGRSQRACRRGVAMHVDDPLDEKTTTNSNTLESK